MKIIGNRMGLWLVGDEIDETADEYQCEPEGDVEIIIGDPEGECIVGQYDGLGYAVVGRFSGGEMQGKWMYRVEPGCEKSVTYVTTYHHEPRREHQVVRVHRSESAAADYAERKSNRNHKYYAAAVIGEVKRGDVINSTPLLFDQYAIRWVV